MAKRVLVRIPSSYAFLPAVVELSQRLFVHAGLDEQRSHLLALAVEEAITNAIKHSYLGDQSKWVEVLYLLGEDRLEVKISFEGIPIKLPEEDFDLRSAARQRRKGGLGLQIMRRACDELKYGRDGEVNWWLLIKKLKG